MGSMGPHSIAVSGKFPANVAPYFIRLIRSSPYSSGAMISFSKNHAPSLTGTAGSLLVRPDDEITLKLGMLYEGECEGLGPLEAARKFGFSKQRYFQLRHLFQ